MVRSIVAIYMCRGMAMESGVLMQSQANSDMTLSAMDKSLSRVDKVKRNTDEMAEAYRGLLQNIVSSGSLNDPATGTPWLPADSFFDTVREQFRDLKLELMTEKNGNQDLLNAASDAVNQCNTDREDDFAASVVPLQGSMQEARTVHKNCRGYTSAGEALPADSEDNKIDDMEAKCSAFDDLQKKCDDDDEGQNWYAEYEETSGNSTLALVVEKATACKVAVGVAAAKAQVCDENQDDFETKFCSFAGSLKTTCNKHTRCYTKQEKNFNDLKTDVEKLEGEQKRIWTMTSHVECLVQILLAAESPNNMPTQDQINTCTTDPYSVAAYGIKPETELNIAYPTPDKKQECYQNSALKDDDAGSDGSIKPGDATWNSQEYVDKNADFQKHSKLESTDACAR